MRYAEQAPADTVRTADEIIADIIAGIVAELNEPPADEAATPDGPPPATVLRDAW